MGYRVLIRIAIAALAALGAAAGPVHAGPTGRIVGTVNVTDDQGKPAASTDVIVYVVGFPEPAGTEVTQIEQKGRKFVPDLVAITVGEKVSFPNRDGFLHNVFSQSPPRRFDLGSFKAGMSKERGFPDLGVIDVYCNIHPEMAATILVLPNRHHVRASADGHFTLDGVPPGDWSVFAYVRRAVKPAMAKVSVAAGADTTANLTVVQSGDTTSAAAASHLNKYGEKYHDTGTTTYR